MQTVVLAGRTLRVLTSANIAHDFWLTRQIRLAGIDQILIDPSQDPAAFVDAILDRLMVSGMAITLLSGLLAPVELEAKDWTSNTAADMAAFLNALTADADKLVVRGLMAETVLGFFQAGLVSLRTSRTSSTTDHEPAASSLSVPTVGS
jgi:hypothetical protein